MKCSEMYNLIYTVSWSIWKPWTYNTCNRLTIDDWNSFYRACKYVQHLSYNQGQALA